MTAKRMLVGALAMVAAIEAASLRSATPQPSPTSTIERRLYVANDRGGVSMYDIDHGHTLLRTITIANPGVYKGIAVSVSLGRLYLTAVPPDTLIGLDLVTEKELWRKTLGKYADSPAITPDGKTLYVPYRHEDNWKVIDAESGEVRATIPVARGKRYEVDPIADIGPHNTWVNRDGTRVYFEVLTEPYIWIADTRTNMLLGKVGPFSKGIRPFAVTDDERFVYASVDALLGFEVGAVTAPGLDHVQHRWAVCVPRRRGRHRHRDQESRLADSDDGETARDRFRSRQARRGRTSLIRQSDDARAPALVRPRRSGHGGAGRHRPGPVVGRVGELTRGGRQMWRG